jgi:hypothetical protein
VWESMLWNSRVPTEYRLPANAVPWTLLFFASGATRERELSVKPTTFTPMARAGICVLFMCSSISSALSSISMARCRACKVVELVLPFGYGFLFDLPMRDAQAISSAHVHIVPPATSSIFCCLLLTRDILYCSICFGTEGKPKLIFQIEPTWYCLYFLFTYVKY